MKASKTSARARQFLPVTWGCFDYSPPLYTISLNVLSMSPYRMSGRVVLGSASDTAALNMYGKNCPLAQPDLRANPLFISRRITHTLEEVTR